MKNVSSSCAGVSQGALHCCVGGCAGAGVSQRAGWAGTAWPRVPLLPTTHQPLSHLPASVPRTHTLIHCTVSSPCTLSTHSDPCSGQGRGLPVTCEDVKWSAQPLASCDVMMMWWCDLSTALSSVIFQAVVKTLLCRTHHTTTAPQHVFLTVMVNFAIMVWVGMAIAMRSSRCVSNLEYLHK